MGKLTISHDIITNAKQELIEKIKANINMDRIREICAEKYGVTGVDNVEFKDGDIISYGSRVAYKMEYQICFCVPVLLDEQGNYINIETEGQDESTSPEERLEELAQQSGNLAQSF